MSERSKARRNLLDLYKKDFMRHIDPRTLSIETINDANNKYLQNINNYINNVIETRRNTNNNKLKYYKELENELTRMKALAASYIIRLNPDNIAPLVNEISNNFDNLDTEIQGRRVSLLPPVETTVGETIQQAEPVDESSQGPISRLISGFKSFIPFGSSPNPVSTSVNATPITSINFDSNIPIAESMPVAQALDDINANILQSLDNVPTVTAIPTRPTGQRRSGRSPRNRNVINENIGGGAPPEFYE